MSNIVFPTQDHQMKAFESGDKPNKDGKSNDENNKKNNLVQPTQQHQLDAFNTFENTKGEKKGSDASGGQFQNNVVIPNQEQMSAFENKSDSSKGGNRDEGSEVHDTQFETSVFNLLMGSPCSIFHNYTRKFSDYQNKLDSRSSQLIVFAPTDQAVESLSKKPWEFPKEVSTQNDGKDEVSDSNIKNFIGAHIVDSTDFKKIANANGVSLQTIGGESLNLVNDGSNSFAIEIGGKKVATVVNTQVVQNGALLTIDHPLVWPQ